MEVNVVLPPKLAGFYDRPARYRVAYGGRGSGKSWAFARMMLVRMLENPNTPFLFARELQNSIKDSVHRLLVAQVEALGLKPMFEYGESFFRCKNGAYGIFKGLRTNAQEIKSLEGVKFAWVEEAQKVSKQSLELLIPTIRAPGSEIWFTYNPDEDEDAVHQMFVVNEPPPTALVIKLNWSDNPWFPAELNDEREYLKMTDPDAYDHVWEGNTKKFAGGAVYGRWLVEAEPRIASVPYNPAFPVLTAWDLGYADSTSIWFCQLVGKEPRLIDFYQANLESLDHYVKVLREKGYNYSTHILPHDAGHASLRTGTTLVKQLEDMGLGKRGRELEVLPVDSIESGIELARSFMSQAWFDATRCKDGLKALRHYHYEYDEERGKFKDKPAHDWSSHACDAFRYLATYQARLKPVVKVKVSAYHTPSQEGWML